MAAVNMTLDDIIQANKTAKKTSKPLHGRKRTKGFRAVQSSGRRGAASASRFPRASGSDGKWKHDKFMDHEKGFSETQGRSAASGNPNRKVMVNLSNLGEGVIAADLEELFEPYNPEVVSVHFNEAGQPLGTGQVWLKRQDAVALVKDFQAVCLDGLEIKMKIMEDSTTAPTSVKQRLTRLVPSVGSGGITKRTTGFKSAGRVGGGVQKRSTLKKKPSRFLDRLEDDDDEPTPSGKKGGRRQGKTQKTVEELDAELEAYMNKGLKV